MGVKDRLEREREATSRAILDAARDLFVSEGYANVTIRRLAERIDYSPAAIYSYFPSKDDIFLALAEEGFRMLFESADALREASAHASPIDCIRSSFLQIYQFSRTHPEYHALMFLDRSVPKISRDWERFDFVRRMRGQVIGRIQAAIEARDFPATTNAETVFRVLLAATQGVASMRLCDRLTPGEDADALARITIDAALAGFRAGFPQAYEPGTCP